MLCSGTNLAFIVFVPKNLKRRRLTLRLQLLVLRNVAMHGQISVIELSESAQVFPFQLSCTMFFHFSAQHCPNLTKHICIYTYTHSRHLTAVNRGSFTSWRGLQTRVDTGNTSACTRGVLQPWKSIPTAKTIWSRKGNVYKIAGTATRLCSCI